MHYEKKLAVSKTVVLSIAFVQSMYKFSYKVQFLPLGFVIFHLQHFGESTDFYQTSIEFYFLNMQVLHSLDILKQEDIDDI